MPKPKANKSLAQSLLNPRSALGQHLRCNILHLLKSKVRKVHPCRFPYYSLLYVQENKSAGTLQTEGLPLVQKSKVHPCRFPYFSLIYMQENKSTRTLQTEGLPRGAKIQGPPLVRTPTIPKACPWSAHSLRTTMTTVKGLSSKSLNKLPSDWSIRPSTRWKSY